VHPTLSGRELDGVRHEVHDHLVQAQPVAPHGDEAGLDVERQKDALLLGRMPERLDGLLDQGREVQHAKVELRLAGDDARDVEEIVDELRLKTRVPLDGLEPAFCLELVPGLHLKHPSPPEDRRERIPQLVR
jgi:hypothetical protein